MSEHIVSHDQLIKVAGLERYKRGLAASETQAVTDFNRLEGRISGKIQSFESNVRINGEVLEGACSCKESDGFDFCQHCVQLVLFSNKRVQQLFSLSKGPDKSKVFAFLLGQEKQVLAKYLLNFIEQDPAQFDRFLLKASLASGQIDFPELRSRLTELTRPNKSMFSQRQVKHYFSRIARLFIELKQAELAHQAESSLKLIEYSVARLNSLLQSIDETWGYSDSICQDVQSLFTELFALQEGRTLTIVKRFEKVYFNDRFEVLGDSAIVMLAQHAGANELFFSRAIELWRTTQIPQGKAKQDAEDSGDKKSTKKDATFQGLVSLSEPWQWAKLAKFVVTLDAPKKQDPYLWDASLQRYLVTSSESCLDWAKRAESEYGVRYAVEVLLDGVTRFPNSQRLVDFLCSLLVIDAEPAPRFRQLADDQPIELVTWLANENNELSAELVTPLLTVLATRLERQLPKSDFDEQINQARVKLLVLCERHSEPELALKLGMESDLPAESKITLARSFDSKHPDFSRQIRELLIGELLAKKQNRCDHLAAEQTVMLQKNYAQLKLSGDSFAKMLKPFESLINERKNFIPLVQQYREKQSHDKS